MKTLTVEMVREWGPCYDPTDIDGVGEDWTGTVIDVLNSNISHDDKLWVVLRRELLPDSLLREFSRLCALQVIDMWEAPQIVRDYLETGDDKKRAAAMAAAWAAASDSARATARATASDSARAAARAAAWAAARAAAWAAARDSARATASDSARGAAWAAARDSARATASDSARGAAWAAAWAAAMAAQVEKLTQMIMKEEAAREELWR